MTVLDKFLILFESDADETSKEIKKLDKTLDKTEKSAKSVTKQSTKLSKEIKGLKTPASESSKEFLKMGSKALGAVGGVVALTGAVVGLIARAKELRDLGIFSNVIGENIKDVDAWGGAVTRAGGDAGSFRSTIESLNEKMIDAKIKGFNEIIPFFNQLGISIIDTNGKVKKTLNILPELADAFGRIGKQKSLGIGKKLGLDAGTIALLQKGRAEVNKLIKRQKKLGLANKEAAKLSKEFVDIMADFKQVSRSISQGILVEVLPAIIWMIDKLTDFSLWAKENKPIVLGFFAGIAAVATPALISLAVAGWAAIAPLLAIAAPFLAIAAAAGVVGIAIALVVEDIIAFTNGQDSLIGKIAEKWPLVGEVVKFLVDDIKSFFEIMKTLGSFLLDVFVAPEKALEKLKSGIKSIKEMLDSFSADAALDKISETFDGFKSFLGFGNDDDPNENMIENEINKNIMAGQGMMALASSHPISSHTSNSIKNSSRTMSRSTSIQTGDINIQTQATDSKGIASDINGSLKDEMRTTVDNFDDGIDR